MNWILCIIIVLFSGCQQKSQENHYTEIVVQTPQVNTPSVPVTQTIPSDQTVPADHHAGLDMSAMSGLIDAPTQQNILNWVSPDGWGQEAGKHMRMVTFHPVADPQSIDCYIIALAGPAGGLEANLQRWLGQLGIQASDDNLKTLSASSQIVNTKDGLEVKVFDFTTLQTQGNSSDKSMMVAMIPVGQTTVFVKMTGSIESVKQNKDSFLTLLGSITRK